MTQPSRNATATDSGNNNPLQDRRRTPWRLPSPSSDIIAAGLAATLVAPVVTSIDRAVVETSVHSNGLLRNLWRNARTSCRSPGRFLSSRPFMIIWTLYAATFITANQSETICRRALSRTDTASVSTAVFLSTCIVNIPLSVWKDIRFAQIFARSDKSLAGTATTAPSTSGIASIKFAPPAPTTTSSILAFARRTMHKSATTAIKPRSTPTVVGITFLLRDAITLFGSFTLVPLMTPFLNPPSAGSPPDGTGLPTSTFNTAIAQLVAPMLTQLVATPIHLLGLDLFNRPSVMGLRSRAAVVARDLPSITLLRAVRIVPAFGFGVLVNGWLRGWLRQREAVDDEDCQRGRS